MNVGNKPHSNHIGSFVTVFYYLYLKNTGVPWWLRRWRIRLQCGRPGFNPWVGKIPWKRTWQPTPVFLPGESPQTEEPGGLQSMGSQKVGHDWATKCTDIKYNYIELHTYGLPWWLRDKESACKAGDPCLIPGSGRPPEEGMATHSSILA